MNGCNVLVAFPYASGKIVEKLADMRKRGAGVYIDSGAFTAWSKGRSIKLVDYVAFLRALPFKPTGHFQLDVIGNGDATLANLRSMTDAGLKPIGVFQRGMPESSIAEIRKLCDVISLGGIVGTKGVAAYCRWFINRAGGAKVHTLGHVSPYTIASMKPHSCDSTHWMYAGRGLALHVYAGRGIRVPIVKSKHQRGPMPDDLAAILASYEVHPKDVRLESWWKRGARVLGARTFVRMSYDAERQFGTSVYGACSSLDDLETFDEAWRLERFRRGER